MTLQFRRIHPDERKWIASLPDPFGGYFVATNDGNYEVFTLYDYHYHSEFNPFKHMIVYMQNSHIGEQETSYNTRGGKTYYIHQPFFRPTGTIALEHNMGSMTCYNGILHDQSGNPAYRSNLFGNAYYFYGESYEPMQYFELMEARKYKEYDPQKYIDFMAELLGEKINA